MDGSTVVEKDTKEDVAIRLFGRRRSVVKAVIWKSATVDPTVQAFARVIWYLGALGSFLDGITTWFVLTHAQGQFGERETNGFVATAIHHLGIVVTCGIRVLIGVVMFWVIGNELSGKIYFLTHFSARRYEARMAKTGENKFRQWRIKTRVYHAPLFASFLLVATWAVVGNNLNALYILAHN